MSCHRICIFVICNEYIVLNYFRINKAIAESKKYMKMYNDREKKKLEDTACSSKI